MTLNPYEGDWMKIFLRKWLYIFFLKLESMTNRNRGRKEQNRLRNWRKQNQKEVKEVVNLVQ